MVIKRNGVTLTLADKIKVRKAYDETMDTISFTTQSRDTVDLKVGTWFDVDGYPYMLESFNITPKLGGVKKYNYNLIEGIAYMQSIIMPNLVFSQRLGLNKTLLNALDRLSYVCVTQLTHTPVKQFEIVYDRVLDTIAPEFFFNDSTLFDALVEIGEYVGHFPKLEYDDLGNPRRVRFVKIDKPTKSPINVLHAPIVQSHSLTEYANTFRITGDNLIANRNDEANYPLEINTTVATDVVEMVSVNAPYDTVTITGNNSRLTVSQPIYKIKKVDIFYRDWRVIPTFKASGFGSGMDEPLSKWCVDFKTWIALPPTFTVSGMGIELAERGKHRESTMYYEIGGRDILNIENMLRREFYVSDRMDVDDVPFGDPVTYFQEPYIRNIEVGFRVTYTPMSKNFIVTKKNKGNVDWIKSETLSGAYIDVSRAAQYAERQIKGALSRNFDYNLLTKQSITPGATIDDRFINVVSETLYNGSKRVMLGTLTEYNRKSSMIEVNRNPNPYEISTDRVSERILQVRYQIKAEDTGIPLASVWLAQTFIRSLMLVSYTLPAQYLTVRFNKSDSTYERIAMPIHKLAFAGSVVYKSETYDNVITGVSKVTEYDIPILRTVVVNQRGIIYTDENGEVLNSSVILSNGIINNMDKTEYKKNYPLLEADQFPTNNLQTMDIYIDKDTREKIIFNFQFDIDGVKFTDFGLLKSPFIENVESGSKRIAFYNRLLDVDDEFVKMNNNDPFATTTFTPYQVGNSAILTLDTSILNGYYYTAYAVYNEDNNMMYYRNVSGVINNSITITIGG